jgi:vacuolar-type H+-ATPase subunit I/STV1
LVNIFSDPKYREINPALFTVVTFPIQFGIMFGDMGHGSLWLCIALFVFISGKKLGVAHDHRYLVLMMGFFATYCGTIYNEMFSIPFDLWGTCYNLYDTKVADTAHVGVKSTFIVIFTFFRTLYGQLTEQQIVIILMVWIQNGGLLQMTLSLLTLSR